MNHSSYCMTVRSLYPLWGILGEAFFGALAKPVDMADKAKRKTSVKPVVEKESHAKIEWMGGGSYRVIS